MIDPIDKVVDMWEELDLVLNQQQELIGAEPIVQKNGIIFGYRCEVCHRNWKINQKRNCTCLNSLSN